MALPKSRSTTRGVLTSQPAAPSTPAAPVINPAWAGTSIESFNPDQQQKLSQLLDAVQKSYGKPLTPSQIEVVLQNRKDFLSDIGRGEGIQGRINREMPSLINKVKTTAKEDQQEEFQSRSQTMIEEAMASGKEFSQKQLQLMEEQLNLSKQEIADLQEARKKALAQADTQAKSAQTVANELYRQAGLKATYDESGTLTGLDMMAEDELQANMTPLQKQQYQVAKQTTQKQLDALAGKFDMDPALQESLRSQEEELRAVLEQKLGPNYETSTPGIQALTKFREAKTRIEESARLSWIQTGQGLVTSALQNEQAGRQGPMALTAGTAGTQAQLGQVGITAPLGTAPINRTVNPAEYSGVLSTQLGATVAGAPAVLGGYQNILAPRYAQTEFERRQSLMRMQGDGGSPWSGVISGLLGTAAGAAGTALGGPLAGVLVGGTTQALTGAAMPDASGSVNLPPPRY